MKGSFDGEERQEGRSFGFRFRAADDSSGNHIRDSHEINQNYSQIKEDESSSNS